MIRAILEGRKTQTRRILRTQPSGYVKRAYLFRGVGQHLHVQFDLEHHGITRSRSIHFGVSDRLWVREAWRTFFSLDKFAPSDVWPRDGKGAGIAYEAGGGLSITHGRERRPDYSLTPREDIAAFGKLRSSVHMPRWASRITLVAESVRVQRLQEISEEDACREGFDWEAFKSGLCKGTDPKSSFAIYWNSLYGDSAWSANPWICAISFRTTLANIDSAEAQVK